MATLALILTHSLSMLWFGLCALLLLARALRQWGFVPMEIFSDTRHLALVVILVANLFCLFVPFRRSGRTQQARSEHPLTTATCYMAFYAATPLLGGLAGIVGMSGTGKTAKFALGVALATFCVTFIVWLIIHPVLALSEILLYRIRTLRARRLAGGRRWDRPHKKTPTWTPKST